jgi:hypothetical protein
VYCIWKNTYKILFGKLQEERWLMRSRHRCWDNIKIALEGIDTENVNSIELHEDNV